MNHFRTIITVLLSTTLITAVALTGIPLRSPALAHAQTTTRPPTTTVGHMHFLPSRGWLQRYHVTANTAVNVTYHGGPVMHTSTTYAIFWLPAGYSFEPYGSDANYESLIERYFRDVGNTTFYNILTQYYDSSGKPLNSSILGGVYLDTNPYPTGDATIFPITDSQLQAEIAQDLQVTGWRPGPTTEFFVFTGYDVQSCSDSTYQYCAFSTYCAYHSSFTLNGQTVIYANMPDPSDICTVPDAPDGDPLADAAINALSHEHFESVSDPEPGVNPAWIDADGQEIGDKCAYNYGTIRTDGSNITLNGHEYLVQQEWSNAISGCALSYVTSSPPPSSWHVEPSNTTNVLTTISCPAASICYAIGANGTILTTTNGGSTWVRHTTGTSNALTAIACPGISTCYVVGALGTILTTTNGGSTWVLRSSGTSNNLYGITCTSASTCYAVGAVGTILFTTNGGSSWTRQVSNTTNTLNAVVCPSSTVCYAVGAAGTILGTS
jgi:hypothetical protein